jgi:hypothetical protein
MDGLATEMSSDGKILPWMDGTVDSAAGPIPRAKTALSLLDRAGSWKMRWSIERENFLIEPGLYAVGTPDKDSHVLVSANYKMSFDHLREALPGLDAWILVIDTKGINVWCAAGKGTFCTAEIAAQTEAVNLEKVVAHRRLILPQLGAAGVSAQKVAAKTGFRVTYGPVRAADIPAFLSNKLKATEEMRTVRFPITDRLVLTPIEIVISFKYIFLISALTVLVSGLGRSGFSPERATSSAPLLLLLIAAGWLGGAFLGPLLLPYLPGRSFSIKGAIAGLIALGAVMLSGALQSLPTAVLPAFSLIVVATASFLTMNFTGCSTYTSPSGVRKEMTVAVPIQAALLIIGAITWIASLFLWR